MDPRCLMLLPLSEEAVSYLLNRWNHGKVLYTGWLLQALKKLQTEIHISFRSSEFLNSIVWNRGVWDNSNSMKAVCLQHDALPWEVVNWCSWRWRLNMEWDWGALHFFYPLWKKQNLNISSLCMKMNRRMGFLGAKWGLPLPDGGHTSSSRRSSWSECITACHGGNPSKYHKHPGKLCHSLVITFLVQGWYSKIGLPLLRFGSTGVAGFGEVEDRSLQTQTFSWTRFKALQCTQLTFCQ